MELNSIKDYTKNHFCGVALAANLTSEDIILAFSVEAQKNRLSYEKQ